MTIHHTTACQEGVKDITINTLFADYSTVETRNGNSTQLVRGYS